VKNNNNSAFVLLFVGPIGGAQKRFVNLVIFMNKLYPGNHFMIVSYSLFNQIKELFVLNDYNMFIPVGSCTTVIETNIKNPKSKAKNSTNFQNSVFKAIQKSLLYKLFYFYRSRLEQHKTFLEIKEIVRKYHITSLIGVFNGIIPLYFYLKKNTSRPGIIYCNMDSWFSSISLNAHKDWHRKYVSFNYAHEKSDLVDFLSPFICKGIQGLGIKIPDAKVRITPCSFTDYSKCHIGAKNKFRIAFSGRLENDKNPVMFINAAIVLAKKYPDVEFHILGEGRLSEVIRDITVNSNLPNIVFHGFHPNPPEILAGTSVFVSIQTTNNYPSQSVLEAMACGNAIIATDVGDTRLFMDKDKGSLIELSYDALSEELENYIMNPNDARIKGNAASEYVRKNHTIKQVADYYLNLLNEAAIISKK